MLIGLLFLLMLLVMLMRVYLPVGARRSGKEIKVVRLSLAERYLLQRVNLYAIGSVLVLMTVTNSISTPVLFFVLLSVQLITLIPVRCHLTSDGVGLNNVVFRPWSDFIGFSVSARRVALIAREGSRPLNLPVLGDHQKEAIAVLCRHLPEIKTGKEAASGKRVTVN
jgi:hypothetical protein